MENALWNKAVPLYEKGLEIEGSNAEFSLQLMQCYSNLGHKASAINVYDTFMKKFGHCYIF